MNPHEMMPTPETPTIKKEQVIEAYKKIIDQGATNPDSLDVADPEVQAANDLYFQWIKEGMEAAGEDAVAQMKFNSEINFFYLDAGFTDPRYASDILEDFAEQDIENAKEVDPEFAAALKKRVAEYKAKLLSETD